MKVFILTILLLLFHALSMAQKFSHYETIDTHQADSLKKTLTNLPNDTLHMKSVRSLGFYYQEIKRDSSLYYHNQQFLLARQMGLKLWEADALDQIGYILMRLGAYSESLQSLLQALQIADDAESERNLWHVQTFTSDANSQKARLNVLASIYSDLGTLYTTTGNNKLALSNLFKAISIEENTNYIFLLSVSYQTIATNYIDLNVLDSALFFMKNSLDYSYKGGIRLYRDATFNKIGLIYFQKGDYVTAKRYFKLAMQESQEQNNTYTLADVYINLANLLRNTNASDSSVWYARKAIELYQLLGAPDGIIRANISLSATYYIQNKTDSAFICLQRATAERDSLMSAEKVNKFQSIEFGQELRQQALEQEKSLYQNKIRTYGLLAGLTVILLVAAILYRNNRQKQKTNKVLEKTLHNLKSTQAQLIQSEKMASLGELTAGIAHEIQNPLNFVNNFSEVNVELIEELKSEKSKVKSENGDLEDEILNDIEQNLQKILYHGKRADSIVKGMLQHSRASSGKKELVNINALVDQALRLSYHGLRAKDKDFNATINTNFDESIDKINIIPQDISRVLLNLFNNAFYAVDEKKRQLNGMYKPVVSVCTKKMDGKVEIHVRDNGNGIPQNIVDKIFQPFFTTKPTGQGTGLGLSLSYDVIKAHGGEIKVETKEGEGGSFIIKIPIV